MAAAGDPVATGIVESLGRPGGNITGLSQMNPELMGKRLKLLKEIVPELSSIAVLLNPEDPISELSWNEIQVPARQLGLQAHALEVRSSSDLNKMLEEALRARIGALAIMPNPVFVANLRRIADFALENRLASMFHLREFADVGGLLSYGVDRSGVPRSTSIKF